MDADVALAMAREALKSRPADGEVWRALGMAHELRQEFDQAVAAYEQALQLLPDDASLAGDLGRLAHRLGMLSQAAQLLCAHLKAHPDSPDSINLLACVLRDQHDHGAAIALLQDAIRKAPSDHRLWNTLGTVLGAQGENGVAVTFFEEALRLQPDHAGARYNLACAQLDLGDARAALASCDQALGQAAEPTERATIRFARATSLGSTATVTSAFSAARSGRTPANRISSPTPCSATTSSGPSAGPPESLGKPTSKMGASGRSGSKRAS